MKPSIAECFLVRLSVIEVTRRDGSSHDEFTLGIGVTEIACVIHDAKLQPVALAYRSRFARVGPVTSHTSRFGEAVAIEDHHAGRILECCEYVSIARSAARANHAHAGLAEHIGV